MTAPRRAVVVGFGYAGQRFARVIQAVGPAGEQPVELVGVVDRRPVLTDGLPVLSTVREAVETFRPDIVCVTVNENDHAAVFDELADAADRPLTILAEKPLTSDLESARRVAERLRGHTFSMNLVERYSPVLDIYRSWAAARPELEVVRVESHWGKHRVFDLRPTMGVMSELIHPLDLVQELFRELAPTSIHALGVASDFDESASGRVLDSIDVAIDAGGVPVLLHGSFSWPGRIRTVTALLRDRHGLCRVLLTFDQPHWDLDQIRILRVEPGGRYTTELEHSIDVGSLDAHLMGVNKVAAFVRQSISDNPGPGLVGLDEAVRLQELVTKISRAAQVATVHGRYRDRSETS